MRKLLIIIWLILVAAVVIKAQDVKVAKRLTTPITDSSGYTIVRSPKFPGGLTAFYKYIANNLHPTGEKGAVYIKFIIEADGSVDNVTVQQGLSENTNQEAIRVISGSPKWTPGTYNGKPVKVPYTVPLHFN